MQLPNKYRTVLSNFTYLSILNGLDILLPLLIIPYLTHVVGASNFGDYLFVLVLIQNVNNLTAYGYNFSATKKISQHRHDAKIVNRTYNAVIGGRLLLAISAIAFLLIFSSVIFKNYGQFFIFITAIGMILGDVFIPSWLFQGMERMKYLTIVNATTKIFFTLLVLLLITQRNDYIYILLINSIGYLIAAVISQFLAYRQFAIKIELPTMSDIRLELREGLALFSTTIGMTLYRNLNVIILNYFVSSASVAVYGIAEKVVKACQSLVNPISQALFPHLSYQFGLGNMSNNLCQLRKIAQTIGLILLLIALSIFCCSGLIPIIFGQEFTEAIPLTNLMLPVFVFGCLNYVLGFAGLINLNQQNYFFIAVMLSGTISILSILLLVRYIDIYAAAISMNLSEIILFILCSIKLIKLYYEHKKQTIEP